MKAAATVGKVSRGYDAGKKINGRKRHLVVDTRGLPLFVMVTPADLHDSAVAEEVLFRLRLMHPEITIAWADRAYAGKLVTWAKRRLNLTIKTVKGTGAVGEEYAPQPRADLSAVVVGRGEVRRWASSSPRAAALAAGCLLGRLRPWQRLSDWSADQVRFTET